jgi:hypothetical protein
MRLEVRHIESGGVGYHDGYTTFAGFFSYVGNNWVPFLDARAHVFDNGRPAANAGLGLRYVGHRVWGVNGYYDYRRSHHHSYNQGAFGLESLGVTWDFRANGYFPAGNTHGRFFDFGFDGFEGHQVRLSRRQDFAMKGGNAEVGVHVNSICNLPLYFAAGPYYFKNEGKHAWGGEGRVAMDYFDYLRLEAMASYDHIFRGKAQGQISLIWPFGSRSSVQRRGCDDCCRARWINQRAVQRVDRNEIIVLDTHTVRTNAIDPATNRPYVFQFVDNRSRASEGTFEHRYATLTEAQDGSSPGDFIYVFAGDYSSTGLDEGITLQDDQVLLGAGLDRRLDTTLGRITIPSQQPGFPLLDNIGTDVNVITAANHNEIAGLHILTTPTNTGILFNGTTDGWVHDNIFDISATNSGPGGGVGLGLTHGTVRIDDNLFRLTSNSANNAALGVFIVGSTGPSNTYIDHNSFNVLSQGVGSVQPIFLSVSNFDTIAIRDNLFQGSGATADASHSIAGAAFTGTGTLDITDNLFNQTAGTLGDVLLFMLNGSDMTVNVIDNSWTNTANPTLPSLGVVGTAGSVTCIRLIDNVSPIVAPNTAYFFQTGAGATMTLDAHDNVGPVTELGTITNGPCP